MLEIYLKMGNIISKIIRKSKSEIKRRILKINLAGDYYDFVKKWFEKRNFEKAYDEGKYSNDGAEKYYIIDYIIIPPDPSEYAFFDNLERRIIRSYIKNRIGDYDVLSGPPNFIKMYAKLQDGEEMMLKRCEDEIANYLARATTEFNILPMKNIPKNIEVKYRWLIKNNDEIKKDITKNYDYLLKDYQKALNKHSNNFCPFP